MSELSKLEKLRAASAVAPKLRAIVDHDAQFSRVVEAARAGRIDSGLAEEALTMASKPAVTRKISFHDKCGNIVRPTTVEEIQDGIARKLAIDLAVQDGVRPKKSICQNCKRAFAVPQIGPVPKRCPDGCVRRCKCGGEITRLTAITAAAKGRGATCFACAHKIRAAKQKSSGFFASDRMRRVARTRLDAGLPGNKFRDLSGMVFGRLVAERFERCGRGYKWDCRCACGGRVLVLSNNLTSGKTTSCGCKKRRSVEINGVKYASVVAAAKSLGLSRSAAMAMAQSPSAAVTDV